LCALPILAAGVDLDERAGRLEMIRDVADGLLPVRDGRVRIVEGLRMVTRQLHQRRRLRRRILTLPRLLQRGGLEAAPVLLLLLHTLERADGGQIAAVD